MRPASRGSSGPSLAGEAVLPQAPAAPEEFRRAIASLRRTHVRDEVRLQEIPAPARMAPWTFAMQAEVCGAGGAREPAASGRLILLHDPAAPAGWEGTLRLVTLVTAEVEPEMAADPLLPAVAWGWLTEALALEVAPHRAEGGTITVTTSSRFGDLASPEQHAQVELRASWTPTAVDLCPQLRAWVRLLCDTAGLPPPGVAFLQPRATLGAVVQPESVE